MKKLFALLVVVGSLCVPSFASHHHHHHKAKAHHASYHHHYRHHTQRSQTA
jgi:hypothetical protein